jgi:hypothetical protein
MSGQVRRDAKGRLLPGSAPVPGTGRPRQHRSYLRELIGQRGEKAYDGILAVAEGRLTFSRLVREPHAYEDAHAVTLIPTVKVVPSIRERMDAWTFLAEQLNGKSSIEVHVEHTEKGAPDYAELSDDELAQLERSLAKVRRQVASLGEEVEGELLEDAEPRALASSNTSSQLLDALAEFAELAE